MFELVEACESNEVLRDSDGRGAVRGGVIEYCCEPALEEGSDVLSPKLKRVLVLDGAGLIIAGDILLRKSRYADGGVIGVLSSSLLKKPGDPAIGLIISEGKVPEPGVWSEDAVLLRLSKPAAAMVAVAVAEAIVACRRLRVVETEESNE